MSVKRSPIKAAERKHVEPIRDAAAELLDASDVAVAYFARAKLAAAINELQAWALNTASPDSSKEAR